MIFSRSIVAFLCCAFIVFLTQPVQAKGCYQAKEAEAEQGIRIHSELMVIGLNCQHKYQSQGRNLYMQYRDFTDRHANLFSTYEGIILNYFKRTGIKDPEARLNSLRTSYANKISIEAAKMRPDMFCQVYAPRITKAADMNKTDLRRWAATVFSSNPVSQPLCRTSDLR